MKNFVLRLAMAAACFAVASPALAAPTPEQLIDQLAQTDCHAPGLYPYFPYEDFWAVVPDPDPKAHLEGHEPDCVPDAMRALVRLGPQALPALIRHIGDTRPTGLTIGAKIDPSTNFIGGQTFSSEYESRAHVYNDYGWPSAFLDKCTEPACFTGHGFSEPYRIRIGDVCFTLIGQIVNRYMVAARYQPTGFVIVNSPVETPALAEHVRADWSGVDAEGLKTALLADLHMLPHAAPPGPKRFAKDPTTYEERQSLALDALYAGALRRLRFYFPDAYAALAGDDLARRQAFEQSEARTSAAYARNAEAGAESFIRHLTATNCPLPGVSGTGSFAGFLAEEDSLEAESTLLFEDRGTLRVPVVCQNTDIQNIMHIGPTALPALLRHLDDKRPTKLVVGRDLSHELVTFGGQFFADEYDARRPAWPRLRCGGDASCDHKRSFETPYTVKVGDICFMLVGQIVNRLLSAVRYQPTAILMVNSPVETPALAARVRADWSGIGSEGLKNALLSDLHTTKLEGPPDQETEGGALGFLHSEALRRLRYYYPDAYASLTGADLAMRKAFESDERSRHGD